MPSLPSASRPVISREEAAHIEVGHTAVTPAVSRVLVWMFLIAIGTVPLLEVVGAGLRPGVAVWEHLRRLPASVVEASAGREEPWSRLVAANRAALQSLSAFETSLEQQSTLGRTLRPPMQLLLSGRLGAGNERVYVGRDGWLFYRPDVEYVTGAPFLDARQQTRRVSGAPEWEAPPLPDPRPAIRQLKLDLDARGITLVVVPTPVKPTVHPEQLAAAYVGFDAPVDNPSFAMFVESLRREGILVYDPAPALVTARARTGQPQYLRMDTHWRPDAMQRVAADLATFLARQAGFGRGAAVHHLEPTRVRHGGDTIQMLDLPATQTRYPAEEVEVHRVLTADGTPWQPMRGADVLVLGDSFSNIYSLDSMGWGEAAGFVEHLGAVLQRPVDRLVQNDEGAFATRAMLQRVAASDPARLERTRLVIYQFASRELASGDWRVLPLAQE
jgi:hypothetical protein